MKFSRKKRILSLMILFVLSLTVAAQTPKGTSLSKKQKKSVAQKNTSKPKSAGLFGKNSRGRQSKGKVPKQVRDAEKKKKQQKKAYEKARKQEVKRALQDADPGDPEEDETDPERSQHLQFGRETESLAEDVRREQKEKGQEEKERQEKTEFVNTRRHYERGYRNHTVHCFSDPDLCSRDVQEEEKGGCRTAEKEDDGGAGGGTGC